LPLDSIRLLHQLLWWAHAFLAFGLIVSIPFTKAFHLISSPANMLFRHPAPAGRLPVVVESGVRTVRDYTWRQLLQIDACTWCGKCQEVCPGYNTGFPLSPAIVQAWLAIAAHPATANGDAQPAARLFRRRGLGVCTCRACGIVRCTQHPRLIIDMCWH
jgi:ferredoxin